MTQSIELANRKHSSFCCSFYSRLFFTTQNQGSIIYAWRISVIQGYVMFPRADPMPLKMHKPGQHTSVHVARMNTHVALLQV